MVNNFVCLDLGEKYTKIADISKVNETYEVKLLGKTDTNQLFYTAENEKNIEAQAEAINKLGENLRITKKNVNIIIPDSLTYAQILTMPYLNEKELISAIKYQADQFIPMPIEETNIDLEVIEEYKEQKKILILIVAASKKLIEKIQTTVELAGFIPESIESEISANSRFIINLFKKNPPKTPINFLLANFSLNSTNVSYYEGAVPIIKEAHNFSIGYQLFLKEIQVNTDTDSNKASEVLKTYLPDHPTSFPVETIISPLIREFSSQLKKISLNRKPNAIYIINNISLFPSLAALLEKQLEIPTKTLNPYSFFKKTQLIDNMANDLPLFVSTFGGILR